ncbi:MAG: methyltransferase domain-containing protein [Candidatus Vogelbacteria bacterium]|nr:methyltransferase domain-containing protein [Candidatus Vogelbacteria bacterium]
MRKIKSRLIEFKFYCLRLLWRVKFTFFREKLPKNTDGKVYLNLGCGVNTSQEFINIDAFPFAKTHLVRNIQDLTIFPSNSVDMIYASHVIEHIPRNSLTKTLSEWCRVLKTGGVLRFGVPDLDKLIDYYNTHEKDVESIINQLLGQDADYDRHCTIWNSKFAEKILKEAGFSGIPRFWDVNTTEHHNFNDKSNRNISLNLEISK